MSEDLLQKLAERGEMQAQEFLASVPRIRGDYLDFYPVAALLHADYISTDSSTETGGKKVEGRLGLNTKDTAVFLCQLTLRPGDSFQIDGCPRESAHDFPLKVFITAEGYLRLDELEQRRADRTRKRVDYTMSFGVAILAALLSSYLTHYFATERTRIEHSQQTITPAKVPASPTAACRGRPRAGAPEAERWAWQT